MQYYKKERDHKYLAKFKAIIKQNKKKYGDRFFFTDGACKQTGYKNGKFISEGETAIGVYNNDVSLGFSTGYGTNQYAEVLGILFAIKLGKERREKDFVIFTDSGFFQKAITENYQCKVPHIKYYQELCIELMRSTPTFDIVWIPRELNEEADYLSNNPTMKMTTEILSLYKEFNSFKK